MTGTAIPGVNSEQAMTGIGMPSMKSRLSMRAIAVSGVIRVLPIFSHCSKKANTGNTTVDNITIGKSLLKIKTKFNFCFSGTCIIENIHDAVYVIIVMV